MACRCHDNRVDLETALNRGRDAATVTPPVDVGSGIPSGILPSPPLVHDRPASVQSAAAASAGNDDGNQTEAAASAREDGQCCGESFPTGPATSLPAGAPVDEMDGADDDDAPGGVNRCALRCPAVLHRSLYEKYYVTQDCPHPAPKNMRDNFNLSVGLACPSLHCFDTAG